MSINGVEFYIDFTDADIVEKIEKGSKEVYDKAQELKQKENLSPAEGIRQECKIIKEFLDYVLGEGTSEKIFNGKDSLNQCLQAFEDIINARDKEMKEIQDAISKYSPERLER